MRHRPILLLPLLSLVSAAAIAAPPRTIPFSGYDWEIRSAAKAGPGPNDWSDRNAWVDSEGRLHLKLSKGRSGWLCAQVATREPLGFGTYQFQLVGRIDRLDPNVVFGMFDYPPPETGPDGTNEIDIEFAAWGKRGAGPGNFTVWPAQKGPKPATRVFGLKLSGDYTTHRFVRRADSVMFQSLHGHVSGDENTIHRWQFKPQKSLMRVPQEPLPVLLNLWLFRGRPPTDGKEVEIVVQSFAYTPE